MKELIRVSVQYVSRPTNGLYLYLFTVITRRIVFQIFIPLEGDVYFKGSKFKDINCERFLAFSFKQLSGLEIFDAYLLSSLYRGADKSLAQPGSKQATATEDFDFHISYL